MTPQTPQWITRLTPALARFETALEPYGPLSAAVVAELLTDLHIAAEVHRLNIDALVEEASNLAAAEVAEAVGGRR